MITHAQRSALFGSFSFEHRPLPGNPESVKIDPEWARKNLVSVRVPQLGRTVTVHRLARLPILALWAAWEREGLTAQPIPFSGAWVARFKRQNGTLEERLRKCARLGAAALSNHAYGTAQDIFARELPLGRPCPPGHRMWELAAVARAMGWEWGGDYKTRKDPMHLELIRP